MCQLNVKVKSEMELKKCNCVCKLVCLDCILCFGLNLLNFIFTLAINSFCNFIQKTYTLEVYFIHNFISKSRFSFYVTLPAVLAFDLVLFVIKLTTNSNNYGKY